MGKIEKLRKDKKVADDKVQKESQKVETLKKEHEATLKSIEQIKQRGALESINQVKATEEKNKQQTTTSNTLKQHIEQISLKNHQI